MIEPIIHILQARSVQAGRPVNTAEIALATLGSLPDVLAWLNRSGQNDPVYVRRVFAGLQVTHRLGSIDFSDGIPDWQRARVFDAVSDIATVLADWAVNFYGDNPTEIDLIELNELLKWSANGALFAQVRSERPDSLEFWRKPFKTDPILTDRATG